MPARVVLGFNHHLTRTIRIQHTHTHTTTITLIRLLSNARSHAYTCTNLQRLWPPALLPPRRQLVAILIRVLRRMFFGSADRPATRPPSEIWAKCLTRVAGKLCFVLVYNLVLAALSNTLYS